MSACCINCARYLTVEEAAPCALYSGAPCSLVSAAFWNFVQAAMMYFGEGYLYVSVMSFMHAVLWVLQVLSE